MSDVWVDDRFDDPDDRPEVRRAGVSGGGPRADRVLPFADLRWQIEAACVDAADPEDFFPEGTGTAYRQALRALAVCAECPVVAECWDYAVAMECSDGVWGGRYMRMGVITEPARPGPRSKRS